MKNILPYYITRFDFDQTELNNLMAGGEVEETVDSTGNQLIKATTNTVNNCLINIKQTKVELSSDKIEQHYNTEFSEFIVDAPTKDNPNISISDDITKISDDHHQRESVLETQLDELGKILDNESQRNIKVQELGETNYKATKDLIIDMRIKNGEGTQPSDFMTSFPFAARADVNEPDDSYNSSPYVIKPTD
jgi:hypothetical protein